MNEEAAIRLLETCSNVGRWGPDDELGTLNYLTSAHRIAAAALVQVGENVSLAFDIDTRQSTTNSVPAVHKVLLASSRTPTAALDSIDIAPHGFATTHLDAIGHCWFDGSAWNGRRSSEIHTKHGLTFGSIMAVKDGIVGRGVLLDVAASKGLPYLERGTPITPDDLESAEAFGGVRVSEGDILLVRAGAGSPDVRLLDEDLEAKAAGLTDECIPWLHERRIAVYAGDVVEVRPNGYERMLLPLHMVGLVAMGLVQFDALDLEALSRVAAAQRRYEFLFVCAPLRIPGGTGSPTNPLAIF